MPNRNSAVDPTLHLGEGKPWNTNFCNP